MGQKRIPLAFPITIGCYGNHLHGDPFWSVDDRHNAYGADPFPHRPALHRSLRARLLHEPYILEIEERAIVLETIREVCSHRGWNLIAGHVRMTHLHSVLQARAEPERIIQDFKSYASRNLNRANPRTRGTKRWVRGGSRRCLWTTDHVEAAVRYALHHQGEPMAVFPGVDVDIIEWLNQTIDLEDLPSEPA